MEKESTVDPSISSDPNSAGSNAAANPLEAAITEMQKSLAQNSHQPDLYNDLGNAFNDLRRPDAALKSYEEAIALRPDFFAAFYNRGNTLRLLKRSDAALESFTRAVTIKPDFAEAFNNRGLALCDLRQYEVAIKDFEHAVELRPNFPEALNNWGLALSRLKRHTEELQRYDRALALKPDFIDALNNRATALGNLGRYAEALENYDRIIAARPDSLHAFYNRGITLDVLMRYSEALASYEKAIALKPDFAAAYNNCGAVHRELGNYAAALKCYERAISLQPDFADAYNNCGIVQKDLKQYNAALASYDKAISLKQNFAEAYWNKSQLLLLLGKYREGWALYEWRWQKHSVKSFAPRFKQPLWLGNAPVPRTLLLRAEQGLGDAIQMLRYVPLLAAQKTTIIVEVPPTLAPLVASIPGVAHVIKRGEPPPPTEAHCPLMSLPLAFQTEVATIPAHMPYLVVPEAKKLAWATRLGPKTKPRIGLVWSVRPLRTHGYERRNIPLRQLLPLLDLDADFYSLQIEYRDSDKELLNTLPRRIKDYSKDLVDFSDTAALIEALDVVVCIDTAVAHVAGALAKPVFILLLFSSNWRWLGDGERSPWYSSARLFRQPRAGAWEDAVKHVETELRRSISAGSFAAAQ